MPAAPAVVDPLRFEFPLYTLAEGARYLRVPESTFTTWAHGYVRRFPDRPEVTADAIITAIDAPRGEPRLPFIGLAEGQVVAALRRGLRDRGSRAVPMQRIRRAVEVLREEIGLEHALATRALYTDGARLLYAYGEAAGGDELAGLTVLESGQRVFREVVRDYLQRITYADDGWAACLRLPVTEFLQVDPHVAAGRPTLAGYGVPVDAVLARIRAGEAIGDVAEDFAVPVELLQQARQAFAA